MIGGLGREQCDERVVGGLGDCGINGGATRCATHADHALVTAGYRVDCLIDRQVHDRDRAARAAGAELFAEVPLVPLAERRVVET